MGLISASNCLHPQAQLAHMHRIIKRHQVMEQKMAQQRRQGGRQ